MGSSMLQKWNPEPMRRKAGTPPDAHPTPSQKPREIQSLGGVPWTENDIRASAREFLKAYESRPETQAGSGILSPDAFALWFLIREIKPQSILESGVDKGLSTWILEQGAPKGTLFCLCPDPGRREYISERALYSDEDFLDFNPAAQGLDPAALTVLFNDHRDAFPRIERCSRLGIKRMLFHGNYPEYLGKRHITPAACLNGEGPDGTPLFPAEKAFLLDRCSTYYIFPPSFDHAEPVTLEKTLILSPSLFGAFNEARDAGLRRFSEEMHSYRWTTYLQLK
jgi:hypothetical protein